MSRTLLRGCCLWGPVQKEYLVHSIDVNLKVYGLGLRQERNGDLGTRGRVHHDLVVALCFFKLRGLWIQISLPSIHGWIDLFPPKKIGMVK